MTGKKWDQWQQQADNALKPLRRRHTDYLKVAETLRKLLVAFFLNDYRATTLIEVTTNGEELFDFHKVKNLMAECLIDENSLVVKASQFLEAQETDKMSVVYALDAQVRSSRLSLTLVDSHYQYQFERPYTKKAQDFMLQFAEALSLYRASLAIYEAYFYAMNDSFLGVDLLNNYLKQAEERKAAFSLLANEVTLNYQMQQIRAINREIKEQLALLHVEKVNFENRCKAHCQYIPDLFAAAARKLEASYKQFPNTSSLTCLLVDTEWQSLLKNIAASLFENQYTYSSYRSILTIKSAFHDRINEEMAQLYDRVIEPQFKGKIQRLLDALNKLNETKCAVRGLSAQKGFTMFGGAYSGLFLPPNGSWQYSSYFSCLSPEIPQAVDEAEAGWQLINRI